MDRVGAEGTMADIEEGLFADLKSADEAGDILTVLDDVSGLPVDGEIDYPSDWDECLKRKTDLLRRIHGIAQRASGGRQRKKAKYAKVHAQPETKGFVLTEMKKTFLDLIDPYFSRCSASGHQVDLSLVDEVRNHMDDKLGPLTAEYLYIFYMGWDLKEAEQKRLVAGWKLLGAYMKRLLP